jgi:hypothetical protein
MNSLPTMVLAAALGALVCARPAESAQPDPDIARFITAKSNQVYLATRDGGAPVPPEVWKMFAAASSADWKSVTNLLQVITANDHSGAMHRLAPEVWFRVQDVGCFCGLISSNNLKFIRLFAEEVFKVVPPGSIYFGGSDPGRFIITALSRSQEEGQPFFTLTQSQLVDTAYLTYIRRLYRQQIKLPDETMINEAYQEYAADARQRFDHDQQFPDEPKQVFSGEDIRMVNGQVQITGQVPFIIINGLLVRDILRLNPEHEFYIEENFPLPKWEWMYPSLEPAGPIFKLRHTPLEPLYEETVRNDREYWQRLTRRLIGVVVHDQTDMAEVCAAAQELSGKSKDFQGDPDFLLDENVRRTFSRLRSAGGGIYAWRASRAKSSSERRQMVREAELACRQAYLLCPKSPEAVARYLMFLISEHRTDDAQKFITAALKLNPDDETVKNWARSAGQMSDWANNHR